MVPTSAIKTAGDVNSVFVVKDGAAREQFVQTGILEGDLIQIRQGLNEGDAVVVDNPAVLTDGVQVRVVN